MARRGVGVTKKHMARAERERRQRRWILSGVIAVAVLIALILGYGIYDTAFVRPYQTVAEVNGNEIASGEFEGRVRLIQRELLNKLNSYMQMETLFSADPDILQELQNLELQIETQLANPELLGQDVLESMILQQLLMDEAELQGISVSASELEAEVQRNFYFFPDGTPTSAPTFTPFPTMTLDPEVEASLSPTPSASPGPSPTPLPTSTPRPTATVYTLDAYRKDYNDFIRSLSGFRISEDAFLGFIEIGMLEAKMREAFVADIEREQEQIFSRVILAESDEVANDILKRLEAGEAWEELALEFSLDASTSGTGGEVGWSTVTEMIARYGEPGLAAFASPLGEIVGPFEVEGTGWFLFTVEQRELRPISDEAYRSARNQAFDEWLLNLREDADITIVEDWQKFLPAAVSLP